MHTYRASLLMDQISHFLFEIIISHYCIIITKKNYNRKNLWLQETNKKSEALLLFLTSFHYKGSSSVWVGSYVILKHLIVSIPYVLIKVKDFFTTSLFVGLLLQFFDSAEQQLISRHHIWSASTIASMWPFFSQELLSQLSYFFCIPKHKQPW